MAINGFRADGEVYRYNASALEGDVSIPDGSVTLDSLAPGVIDDTLAVDGAAADAKATGDAITALNDSLSNLIKRVTITGTTSSAGIYQTEYSFNRVISAHPVTGTTAYLAIRESTSHKAVVFAYASSGGSLTSVNNTQITFELIYI